MAYFHKVFPVKVYDLEVPVNFEIPSMYFPPPRPTTSNDTNQTYMKSYVLSVKLFHIDSRRAYSEAESIVDAISSDRNVIPLLNENGTFAENYVRITNLDLRVDDSGVAIIVVNWDSRYYYNKAKATAVEGVAFNNKLKE